VTPTGSTPPPVPPRARGSRITVYDTTLRDGMQGEGMSLSVEEKVRVAHVLDELGVPMIEAGFPTSNPKELELFGLLEGAGLRADVCAFGMTRRRDTTAEHDPALRVLAESFAPVSTIVGKTWSLHLEKVVRAGRDENLAMIGDSVAFLVARGKRVVYDAEHFFDGWRDDPAYALECLRAALGAGAEWLVLCDTNGASLPHQIAAAAGEVAAALPDARLGIHCHNDAECAVANTLAAVGAGATMVQGTMNGYGERCGNANLVSIVPNLQLKLGHRCLPSLEGLTEAAHLVADLLNLPPDPNQPYVGRNAFAHKGGMHVAGVNADPSTFEHIDPTEVGNAREVLVSELSGKGTVIAHAGGDLEDAVASRVVEKVKELEHRGFQFEAADGSFDLLIRRETGDYAPLFRLESWRVMAEKREDGRVETEATIKLWVDGKRYVRTAEGNGPVHALDRALREAIGERFPHLRDIKLVNYKVRILDEWKATGATTRVLLDASDGVQTWGAIGVHENVIEASWDALVDSLEAGMLRTSRAKHPPGSTPPQVEARARGAGAAS
jgi:2-isopropylmalate synthase